MIMDSCGSDSKRLAPTVEKQDSREDNGNSTSQPIRRLFNGRSSSTIDIKNKELKVEGKPVMSTTKRKRSAPERFSPGGGESAAKLARAATAAKARSYVRVKRHVPLKPPSYGKDAAQLKRMFSATCGPSYEFKSMKLLANPNLEKAYESYASNFAQTTVPMLDRSKPPQTSRPRSRATAEEEGIVKESLTFHGTRKPNIRPICKNGFKKPSRYGTYGKAVYSTPDAWMAISYSSGYKEVIGCRTLAFTAEKFGNITAIKNPQRTLPVCLIQFQRKPAKRQKK